MKNLKLPSVAMMMLMALPSFGAAIETVSESFVGSAVTIPGVQTGTERVSFFSLRAVRPALYAGKVTSVGATTITDSGANWTTGLFAGRGSLYAEFDTGLEADIEQVNPASQKLTFSGALPSSLTTGAAYRIREHHTVAEIFGAANEAGLRAGPNSAQAETVLHFIPEIQQRRTYYYLSFNGITGWVQLDYSPASNVVIYPEQGLMVRRVTAGDITLTSSGPLKQWPSMVPIFPGNNLVGLYNRAIPARLDSLNMVTAGFTGGANAQQGDLIRKINPGGISSTTYFYLNLAGFEGWYDIGYQPAGHVTLSPGAVFILYRLPSAAPFDWTMPAQ